MKLAKAHATVSGVASPRFWEGHIILTLREQHYLVWHIASRNTKRQDMLEFFWDMASLAPLGCTCGHRCRASERNFTRGYADRHRAHLAPGTLVGICIACLNSHPNIDKKIAMLRFTKGLIVIVASCLHK